MKKYALILIFMLSLYVGIHAQNGWYPPVHFTGDTNLCDTAAWKLVFYDNFDGDRIDKTKWITYGSYPGMPGGDNEHWNGARSGGEHSFIFRDENVIVSEGTCKLLQRRETNTWVCTDCKDPVVFRRHASCGMIGTRRNLPDGTDNAYNNGRLEARIRFPVFQGAWCAFWTWHGLGVNEIDIAEAWGGKQIGSNQRRNKYGAHAWGPNPYTKPPEPNPYRIPYDAAQGYKFPGQGWWHARFNRNDHRQEDWHTYTCEWEDNLVRYYIDSTLLTTSWKYIRDMGYAYNGRNYTLTIGSGCSPGKDTAYYLNFGFPHNTRSASQVLLWGRVDHQIGLNRSDRLAGKDSVLHPELLGRMEIDYVKIWQRHPEQDNHKALAAVPNDAATKEDDPYAPAPAADAAYGINVVHTRDGKGFCQFQLFETTFFPDHGNGSDKPHFEWDISITNENDTIPQYYTYYGQFVATPLVSYPESKNFRLSWKLKITDHRNNVMEKAGAWQPQTGNHDANCFEAFITDRAAYEQKVYRLVKQHSLSEEQSKDAIAIHSMIEQIRVEELQPYLDGKGMILQFKGQDLVQHTVR